MNLSASFTDQASMEAGAPVEATGPFYFAWADENEAFSTDLHVRWDDEIVEMEIEHNEGDFATLRIVVRNPRIGLLAPGRKRWAWLSWFDGTDVVPLFYGRIVGVPDQIQDEVVELNFIARPPDFNEQKEAVADDVRTYGTWDPIWFSPDTVDDPDNVTEALPVVWHIDRVTHVVTLSDIANGEDGTINLDGVEDSFYDSLKTHVGQNPLRRVQMTATASWQQQGQGTLLLGNDVAVVSYTGKALADAWPKAGASLGNGWSVASSSIDVKFGEIDPAIVGDWVPNEGAQGGSHYLDGGFDTRLGEFGVQLPGQPLGWAYHVAIPLYGFTYSTTLAWQANRRKGETLVFTLAADVQDTVTDPTDDEILLLAMSTSEVVESGAIAATGRSFFTTDRGVQSIEYLIAVARAHLIARARAVTLAVDTSFPRAVAEGITLRKNVIVQDDRLPGGSAGGKITSYKLSMKDGQQICNIEAGCMVGRGGSVTALEGTPTYVEDGYVELGYQRYDGQYDLPASGDVAYESIAGLPPNDDGLRLDHMTKSQAIKHWEITNQWNGSMTQEEALSLFEIEVDERGAVDAENVTYSKAILELVPLDGGPFDTNYAMNVTDLVIPRTIDLEALDAS
jgi:hypothetical protein